MEVVDWTGGPFLHVSLSAGGGFRGWAKRRRRGEEERGERREEKRREETREE
jgi:hypothetical protein